MCVEVAPGATVVKSVVAWKLFNKDGRKLTFLSRQHSEAPYKVGVKYKAETPEGFQAFVARRDAIASRDFSWGGSVLRKVKLFEAQRGTIQGMDGIADGKDAYTGRAMVILS